jgi:hypothetical protein
MDPHGYTLLAYLVVGAVGYIVGLIIGIGLFTWLMSRGK